MPFSRLLDHATDEERPYKSRKGESNLAHRNGVMMLVVAIFCGDIPLHRLYIGLIYGRYLQSRILKWPLKIGVS